MKWLKRTALTLLALAALYGVGRLAVVTYDSFVIETRVPYLQLQTTSGITVRWESPEAEVGRVNYGEHEHNLSREAAESEPVTSHRVEIDGLKSATKYYYNVTSPSMPIDNDDRWFYTLPEANSSTMQRIWVIGDSGKPGKDQQAIYRSAMEYLAQSGDEARLDYWLLLGDNAYTSGTQRQFNDALFNAYDELVKHYVPWAVNGNHDARRWAFYRIFEFPTEGQCGGVPSGNEQFYAIESGNVHIVMLDSEHGDFDPGSDLMTWLEKDLQANTKPWTIVAFHHPPYTDGSHKSDHIHDSGGRMVKIRQNAVPLFDRYGVDLVLSGHSHVYERSHLIAEHTGMSETFDAAKHLVDSDGSEYVKRGKGTLYMVMGSSSKVNNSRLKHPAMPFGRNMMGSVILEVTPTRLVSRFIAIDGTIQDSFTLSKPEE